MRHGGRSLGCYSGLFALFPDPECGAQDAAEKLGTAHDYDLHKLPPFRMVSLKERFCLILSRAGKNGAAWGWVPVEWFLLRKICSIGTGLDHQHGTGGAGDLDGVLHELIAHPQREVGTGEGSILQWVECAADADAPGLSLKREH